MTHETLSKPTPPDSANKFLLEEYHTTHSNSCNLKQIKHTARMPKTRCTAWNGGIQVNRGTGTKLTVTTACTDTEGGGKAAPRPRDTRYRQCRVNTHQTSGGRAA